MEGGGWPWVGLHSSGDKAEHPPYQREGATLLQPLLVMVTLRQVMVGGDITQPDSQQAYDEGEEEFADLSPGPFLQKGSFLQFFGGQFLDSSIESTYCSSMLSHSVPHAAEK